MREKTPHTIIEKLIDHALMEKYISASPTGFRIDRWREKGNGPLPEDLKPGALIKRLTPEEREILVKLVAEDFNHRLDVVIPGYDNKRRGRYNADSIHQTRKAR